MGPTRATTKEPTTRRGRETRRVGRSLRRFPRPRPEEAWREERRLWG